MALNYGVLQIFKKLNLSIIFPNTGNFKDIIQMLLSE